MNHYHEDRPSAWECTCDAADEMALEMFWDLENECAISGDCWDPSDDPDHALTAFERRVKEKLDELCDLYGDEDIYLAARASYHGLTATDLHIVPESLIAY